MPKKVKKQPMAATVTGDIDDLSTADKLSFLKKEYDTAIKVKPKYKKLKKEIATYKVELPTNPDIADLSKINKLYAITQSFSSRITAIEVLAIDNQGRWKRLVNTLEGYIESRHDELLLSKELEDLTIPRAEAAVRIKMKNEFKTLRHLKSKLAEAESFCKMIETKKKDLNSVLTTLGKQVKALSLEHSNR
jgi:hypothetical protein